MATSTKRESLSTRPRRADACRNYDKLVESARAAFTEAGSDASLENIARRAGVGIGTLYRHFPSRQDLLEAVYVEEVELLCRSADDLSELPPWDALVSWLRKFVGYATTKRALSAELMTSMGKDSEVFRKCHDAIWQAGEPLLTRASQAEVVRPGIEFGDVVRLVSGVTMIRYAEPEDIDRILILALDGLRYNAPAARADQTDG